jgi:hypothetical protein
MQMPGALDIPSIHQLTFSSPKKPHFSAAPSYHAYYLQQKDVAPLTVQPAEKAPDSVLRPSMIVFSALESLVEMQTSQYSVHEFRWAGLRLPRILPSPDALTF